MRVYTKLISDSELKILKIASEHDISPKLISFQALKNNKFRSEIQLYPLTLDDIPLQERKQYINSIKDLVNQLHQLQIFHGDISEENIVVDPKTNKVRIIDFGLSKFFQDITPDYYNEENQVFFNESHLLEDLLQNELKEVDFICGNWNH